MFKKTCCSHPPDPGVPRHAVPRYGRSEVRDAKNNEVHDVQNNARQVCERARAGERPVSYV